MAVTEAHCTRDGGADMAGCLAVVEEADMLLPGDADQHLDIPLQSQVEQPLRRNVVGPDRVNARLSHQCQVLIHLLSAGKGAAHRIRLKGTIRDATHEKFSCARPQKFSTDLDTCMFYRGGFPRRPHIIRTHRSYSSSSNSRHRSKPT
jgi:hypothetical protein